MKQNREFRELCKQVASEFPELTIENVSEIVKDSFKFAQDHISSGSLTPVYFQYLGRFMVKPGRKKWLEEKRKERNASISRKLSSEGSTPTPPEESGV